MVNRVENNGRGILELAEVFIQEKQQTEDTEEASLAKKEKESLFERIVINGNGNVDKDLGVFFWNDQEELEQLLTNVMLRDMQEYTKMADTSIVPDKLWQQMIRNKDGSSNPEIIQVISPYRGEFYGTTSLNLLLQKTLNSEWSMKKIDGVGYFDKVIQFRNRPQSDQASAYDAAQKKNVSAEVFNGEIGLALIHGLDRVAEEGKRPRYKVQGSIERIQVAFSGRSRNGWREPQ